METLNTTALFLIAMQSYTGILAYPGLFLINFVASLTIILPIPSFVVVFAMGSVLNPWLISLFSAAGSTLGEITGYGVGFGGRHVLKKKYKNLFKIAEKWFSDHRAFLVIILFAATPLPFDVIGIIAGMTKYNLKKFFSAAFIGKFIMNAYIAWAGFYGIHWVLAALGG